MSVYLQEPHAKRRANEIVFSENQIYLKFYFRSKEQKQTCCNSFLPLRRRATGPPGRRAVAGRGPPGRRAVGPPGHWAVAGRGPAFSKTPYFADRLFFGLLRSLSPRGECLIELKH